MSTWRKSHFRPVAPVVHQPTLLERRAKANLEDVWNGRPISKIVLAEPLEVLDGTPVSRIELIPPVHQQAEPPAALKRCRSRAFGQLAVIHRMHRVLWKC